MQKENKRTQSKVLIKELKKERKEDIKTRSPRPESVIENMIICEKQIEVELLRIKVKEYKMKLKRSSCSQMTVTIKEKIIISVAFFCRLVKCGVKMEIQIDSEREIRSYKY